MANRTTTQRTFPQKCLLGIAAVIGGAVLVFVALILILTMTEYRPAEEETLPVQEGEPLRLSSGESFRILTWNIGYGCLGDNADFFMDGGKGVKTADEARLAENIDGIRQTVSKLAPNIAFFQEVDLNSTRSSHRNERNDLSEEFPGFWNTFAANFRVLFLPYPVPPIGKVDSGILTESCYEMSEAVRIQLPCPFSWPVRVANLKRCLLVSRLPIESANQELVLVNLHLEAYDNGEGKEAQTAMLKAFLEEEIEKGNYVIAGGDFNQIFSGVDSSAYPVYEGKWQPGIIDVSAFEETLLPCMDNRTPSCRSLDKPYVGEDDESFQFYLIDGFLVSRNIRVDSFATQDEGFVYTDHNPVVMDVTLK